MCVSSNFGRTGIMRKLPSLERLYASRKGFTLLEIVVVLTIVGLMLAIAVYSIAKFRQVIIVSNTAKDLVLELRKARRYAIDNVVTSRGRTTRGYYIFINNQGDYYWGECDFECSHPTLAKSSQYRGIDVTPCGPYPVVKFSHVTGEFILTDSPDDTESTPDVTCIIEVSLTSGGFITTTRRIEVSGESRTVKIL